MKLAREIATYTRAELVSDAIVHAAAIIAALVAAPVLVTFAVVWSGDAGTVTAAAVYGATLVIMFCCSAAYNHLAWPGWHDRLRRVDQSAIYLKIAGAYTPFAVFTGASAGTFLAGIWAAALGGVAMIVFAPPKPRWPALVLYLGIGWAGVALGGRMLASLTPVGRDLLLIAGVTYSLGLVFFLWERLRFHNTIWHAFVFAASGFVYAAVLLELWSRASGRT